MLLSGLLFVGVTVIVRYLGTNMPCGGSGAHSLCIRFDFPDSDDHQISLAGIEPE